MKVRRRIATVVTFNKRRRAHLHAPSPLAPCHVSMLTPEPSWGLSRLDVDPRDLFFRKTSFRVDRRLFTLAFSLIAGTTTVRGVKDTVALNLLENDWSSVVQWMYHQLRKRGKRRGSSTQSFLPPSLAQNNCSHVLAFWQASSCKEGHEGILRIFLCRRLDDGLRVEKDVHSFPVNHMTVSFTRAVHLVYHCLGGRLFSLSFIECIAAKLAYLELSNVFTLTRENTVWIVMHNEDTVMTTDNKLMVGARFMLDDFVQCFPAIHAYTMVNQFSRFVGDYSVDSTKSDIMTAGDYVSHIECRHERIEPLVGDQDFITPHRLDGSFSCNVCSRGNSPLLLGNDKNIIHLCSLICEVCYALRSFLIHYNGDSGTDHDVSQQELLITLDNMSSFFFYRPPTKEAAGGKDISVYREEAIHTLTDFMDNQLVKFEKDRPTSHRLHANELRKHLSHVDQPLKKVNNDKGEVRKQNHANALIILRERGFVQKYLRDYERLYDVDIVEVRDDPSSLHFLKCVDYARCPMPSQLTVPFDTLQKLDTYFKSNQRFKKDKLRCTIEVDILPQLDEAWEQGWHVRVNAREFCQQLLSIQYRVHSGDRFDQRQRDKLCLTNLYRLFDWDTYKEDIANVMKISVHERKLHNTMTRYPLESTLRLDQFFDRDEMTCIALLNLAVFNHVCKSEEEYCFVCITPRPLRYPSQQQQQRGDGGGGEKKKSLRSSLRPKKSIDSKT